MTERVEDQPEAKRQKADPEAEVEDFLSEGGVTDLVLRVEGKPIHVNKGFLMVVSPYFKNLLSNKWKERDAQEIPLEDKKYTEMLVFLRFLKQEKCPELTDENVDFLIPLASFYGTSYLMTRCEEYLLGKYFEVDGYYRKSEDLPSRQTALKHINYYIDHGCCKRLETRAKDHLSRCCLKGIEEDEYFAQLPQEHQFEIYKKRVATVEDHYEKNKNYGGSNFRDVML